MNVMSSCATQKPDFLISCNLFNINVANARTCDLETTRVSLLGPKMLRDDTRAQYVPVRSTCQCAVRASFIKYLQ